MDTNDSTPLKFTEAPSHYQSLESMNSMELVRAMNAEDATVAAAVGKSQSAIAALAEAAYQALADGGRIFYIGSGTSGRLGILDASECPPTFGVPQGMVVGIIAGGDAAIRQAQEGAEDDVEAAWQDLLAYDINPKDIVIGITASGTTPYVIGGLRACQAQGIKTGSIACNPQSISSSFADYPIEVVVGPEFVTGSTRMKSGTAQKMVLNMISTTAMIRLGRIKGNRMVDMQLSNNKLVDRGVKMIQSFYPALEYETAKAMLLEHGSVRAVLEQLG